jgi:hypothetical protein
VSEPIPLFKINPALDRAALAARFAAARRVQIRDLLTPETAATVYDVLARGTPWGLAWNDGSTPGDIGNAELGRIAPDRRAAMGRALGEQVRRRGYGFAYHRYPMVRAYLEQWDASGPLHLLLEHINDEPLMDFVRTVTGMPDLAKADAQATLFAPGQFLGVHNDSHVAEGWRIAYVMNFTRDWHEDWGGYLLFYDEDGDVVAGFRPRYNALNLFAVPQRHNVTYVPPWSPVGRFAITGWFRDK